MRELSILLKQDKGTPKSSLDKLQQIAQIFSLFALPLIVAVGGWWFQSANAKDAVKQKYVELAISILREKPIEHVKGLRRWAAQTLGRYSSEPFSRDELQALESGSTRLPDKGVRGVVTRAPDGSEITTIYDNNTGEVITTYVDPPPKKDQQK